METPTTPLVHFEIHASNPERAAKFYTEALGWQISKWDSPAMEYWIVMTGPKELKNGIHGGLLRRKGADPVDGAPVMGFVCTAQVTSYDEAAAKILAAGGTVAVPKVALAGMAWQGYFKDTEGNVFGIHQIDPNAK